MNSKICGEILSVDLESVDPFRNTLSAIIAENHFLLSHVYNAGETSLNWKAVPKNTQANKWDKSVPGHKINKECLSAFLCSNADGSHRLTSVIVGKSAKLRAIKNIMGHLPVIYRLSKNAWFTREMFGDWFHNHFIPEVKKFQLEVLKFEESKISALLNLDSAPV